MAFKPRHGWWCRVQRLGQTGLLGGGFTLDTLDRKVVKAKVRNWD